MGTFYKDPYLKKLIETSLANNYDLQIAIQKIEMQENNVRFTKVHYYQR
jgi:outer membrane protein TolC